MVAQRRKERQPTFFPNVKALKKTTFDAAEKADCERELSNLLAAVKNNPPLEDETLIILDKSAQLAPEAFRVIVDSLEFAASEKKLQQALKNIPSKGGEFNERIETMRELRRLGLPLTADTRTISADVLRKWDGGLGRYDPALKRKNPGVARGFYHHLLAFNSAMESNNLGLTSYGVDDGFSYFQADPRLLSSVFAGAYDKFRRLGGELSPPQSSEKLDEFLLSLPKFTEQSVGGMTPEKKRAIWHSRVEALIARPEKTLGEDRQRRMRFED